MGWGPYGRLSGHVGRKHREKKARRHLVGIEGGRDDHFPPKSILEHVSVCLFCGSFFFFFLFSFLSASSKRYPISLDICEIDLNIALIEGFLVPLALKKNGLSCETF